MTNRDTENETIYFESVGLLGGPDPDERNELIDGPSAFADEEQSRNLCPECDGSGVVYRMDRIARDWETGEYLDGDENDCLACGGTGWLDAVPEPDDSPSGTGFYATTPEGHAMHVNGARDMPEETLQVLGRYMDLVYKQYANKD